MSNKLLSIENIPADVVKAFASAGFINHEYDGQDGKFLVKDFRCSELSYVQNHIVDNEYIFPESQCVVEICPDGSIQLAIQDGDYFERYFPTEDFDGWKALASDAGVQIPESWEGIQR